MPTDTPQDQNRERLQRVEDARLPAGLAAQAGILSVMICAIEEGVDLYNSFEKVVSTPEPYPGAWSFVRGRR